MNMTFPHMGTAHIPFRTLIQGLGHNAIVAPHCTQKTLAIGTRHAPESACLPLKINIGNYIEAFEVGADTILMAGGVGPCRFGFYGNVQQEILGDLGVDLQMIILEPPKQGWKELINQLAYLTQNVAKARVLHTLRLTWAKFVACDRLEKVSLDTRAYEKVQGDTSRVLKHALNSVDQADSIRQVTEAVGDGLAMFRDLPQDRQRSVLIVGVVGEIYTILEPFVNFCLEE